MRIASRLVYGAACGLECRAYSSFFANQCCFRRLHVKGPGNPLAKHENKRVIATLLTLPLVCPWLCFDTLVTAVVDVARGDSCSVDSFDRCGLGMASVGSLLALTGNCF